MNRRILVTALTLAAVAPLASAQQALLAAPHSEIRFTGRQMGVPVEGRFRRFDAQVAFDPKQPQAARIALGIDLASVTLGAPESEAELAKAPWFDTGRFPQARFQSTSVKALGGGRFDVAGKLTIKGQARDLVVPVALARNGSTTTATGSFPIRRLDFRIGDGEWADTSMVANEVQVTFKLALTGVAPL